MDQSIRLRKDVVEAARFYRYLVFKQVPLPLSLPPMLLMAADHAPLAISCPDFLP
jgi:hypothetical protein